MPRHAVKVPALPRSGDSNLPCHAERDPNTGQYSFTCHYCGKVMHSRTHMRGHLAQHTAVKEFRCPLCSKEFAYKHTMDRHLAQLHGYSPRLPNVPVGEPGKPPTWSPVTTGSSSAHFADSFGIQSPAITAGSSLPHFTFTDCRGNFSPTVTTGCSSAHFADSPGNRSAAVTMATSITAGPTFPQPQLSVAETATDVEQGDHQGDTQTTVTLDTMTHRPL